MSTLPLLIASLKEAPQPEPWVRFCAQCVERERSCVLVTVLEAPDDGPCEAGEHFVFDGDGHGLLPRSPSFSVALHRLTQSALERGPKARVLVQTPTGPVAVRLDPYLARKGFP